MSESPPSSDPAAEPSTPAGVRRTRPKTPTRVHPPVKRTLRDYWVMFRERWYWGLVPAAIIGGVLAYLHLREPELFASTASLQFTAKRSGDQRGDASAGIELARYVEQMRSASFRERVVAAFKPEEIEVIRGPYLARQSDTVSGPDVKSIVADAVAIAPRAGAPFVDVTTTHRDAGAAELITNRYLRSFIEFNDDMSGTSQNDELTEIDARERTQRQRVETAEAQLQEYRKAHGTAGSQDVQNLAARRLTAVGEQLIEAKRHRAQFETTLQQVEESRRQKQPLTYIPYIAAFRGIATLISEIENLQGQRALLERKYLENHPSMKANRLEMDSKTKVLQQNVEAAVAELGTKFREARSNEERLTEEQDAIARERAALEETVPMLRDLEQRVARARELYEQVEKQRNDFMITRGLGDVAVNILDRASAARPLIRDFRPPLLQGGIAALALFFIVPLAFGVTDTRLKAAWEVEQFLKENLLGEMPAIEGVARKERPHIMARDLDHGAAEAFRGLFGQLQLNSTVPYPKLVMLTSTLPGEGKSVVANNLAATFAGHGKKTLLVDCDFRRPNLHVFYGKDNACGVMRWIEVNSDVKGSVLADPDLGILPLQENFYLLRAGGESRRATELFEMEAFGKLFAGLRKQFDIVLIDTPPIGVFPDSMLLSRLVDEIAYVCRFNAVNRSKIRKCIERLRTPNATFAGIILNGIPTGKQSAHYDYYGYGANETKRYKAYYAQRR